MAARQYDVVPVEMLRQGTAEITVADEEIRRVPAGLAASFAKFIDDEALRANRVVEGAGIKPS